MSDRKKTLSAPLRVYWALVPEDMGGLKAGLAVKVAGELAGLKVFFVTLRLASGGRGGLARIIGALKPGVRVTVSVRDAASFPGAADFAGADGLDLMPEDLDGLSALLGLASGGLREGIPVSVSVVPAKDNTGFIDDALALAAAAGVRIFNMPNPDLTRPGAAAGRFALDGETRAALKEAVERRLGPLGSGATLNVHDLFLHRDLKLPGLGARIEYAGCQAGDALAFIDPAGLVYPCSTWPEPLGRLAACSFSDIWASEVRHAMRDMAHTLPDGCAGCPEAAGCKGGCMGMALALGRPGGRDPGCDRR